MHAVIEQTIKPFRGKNATLKVVIPDIGPEIVVPRAVMHFISPLVENSLEAIAARGALRKQPAITIEVKLLSQHDGLSIIVADEGEGWTCPVDRLSQSIRSGHRFSTKGKSRGYGLGNVSRLTAKLGGLLLLSKNHPTGAIVEIRLPRRIVCPT